MEKLAICMLNHKGGVGKTTAALILTEIAVMKGLRVLVVDLDEQKNLMDSIRFAHSYLKDTNIKVQDTLSPADADQDFDLFIIDCPPRLDRITQNAVDFSDVILIPVRGDLYSLTNLGVVYDFIEKTNKMSSQSAILKNGFGQTQISRSIENLIQEKGYAVAGRWPINNHIPNNVASGRLWLTGMTKAQQSPFSNTYKKICLAWSRLQAKNFNGTWR